MRSDVLFSRRGIRIRARLMLAVSHDCSTMPSSQLLVAGIAIVDDDYEAATHALCNLCHLPDCYQRGFRALPSLRVHPVSVEEFELRWRWRRPDFDQFPLPHVDSERSLFAQHLDR